MSTWSSSSPRPRAPRAWCSASAAPTTGWASPPTPSSCPPTCVGMRECEPAAEAIAENALDSEPERTGALDVLAQHIMGLACSEPFDLVALYDELRTAGPY